MIRRDNSIIIGNGLSAAPADPKEGQLYYDQKGNNLYKFCSGGWYDAYNPSEEPKEMVDPPQPEPKPKKKPVDPNKPRPAKRRVHKSNLPEKEE